MTRCFADTSFFLALLNGDDANHERARQLNRIERPVATSSWILLELADHLCDEQNRHLFGELIEALREDARYEIAPADQEILDAATQLYVEREDKDWSLTDCTSFVLMRLRGLAEALSTDHHFEQAGFIALLR